MEDEPVMKRVAKNTLLAATTAGMLIPALGLFLFHSVLGVRGVDGYVPAAAILSFFVVGAITAFRSLYVAARGGYSPKEKIRTEDPAP